MMLKVKTVILLRVGLLLKGHKRGAQSGMLLIWFLDLHAGHTGMFIF